ncbi:MAG TPA: pentapeptide repeat-containing protein [Candidatus Acidoferrales bacterium]|nr:pentapeptide repeat-containing protein [Candidatus Acidoferrales bacterium]
MLSPTHGVSSDEEAAEQPVPARQGARSPSPGIASGLIHARQLPPATETLAELFPTGAPEEKTEIEDTAKVEGTRQSDSLEVLELEAAPKRRGMFSWLFRFQDLKKEKAASKTRELGETAERGGQADSEAGAAVTGSPEGAETLISADQLPAATEILAEIFPAEEPLVQPTSASPASSDKTELASVANRLRETFESDASNAREPKPNEDSVGIPPGGDPPSAPAAEFPAASPPVTSGNETKIAEHLPSHAGDSQAPQEMTSTPAEPQPGPYRDWGLDDKLASHREWVESHGSAGQRADLGGAELEAVDLIGVNLRFADLHDANLRAGDLLLADLRDACLVRADLEESCLVGANLEGANLEGATLETAMGLVPRQLAGTNLRDALLAPQLMEFEAAAKFARNARLAHRYFGAMTVASLISWLLVSKTSDAQLVSDSAVLPFLRSHAAAAALPIAESYLIVPVALFICYLLFHFHLQQLWDSVQELPAIFPNGDPLGEGQPAIIVGLLRTHFRWMNPDPSSTRLVERAVSLGLAYGVVPMTLLLFWARYLTRQEIHGTVLQAALAVVATGIALYASTKVGRPPERWEFEKQWTRRLAAKIGAANPVKIAAILGGLLLFLSAGTIAGAPHERSRAPRFGAANLRRWAPTLFAWLGYDPYPDLTEKSLSARPRSGSAEDDQIGSVDGARLNGAKLRYAQAYGVFLANAHLLRSDLEGAFLSQADLRGADLGESNLRYSVLDQARMHGVNLDRSNLAGADLRRADLRGANLSHSRLEDAILEDARLDGASLYASRLDGATLNRANFEKADLRETFLGGAHMDHVDLQGAYLWSAVLSGADLGGAQFGGAILIDADLRGANLGGAQLGAAVLNNTNLSATSLEGTDLRGALGLTAAQVCSAKSRRGAVMDDALRSQVEEQCGAKP